jgi:hypothetical protein
MTAERATANCRDCAARIVEDGSSPTGWRHIETRLVNCTPPRGTRTRPRHDEPMAVPASPSEFLARWRREQREDVETPNDVRAKEFFGTLTSAAAVRAGEDRLLGLTAEEIALLRPIGRRSAA